MYLPPDEWNDCVARLPGGSLEHLGLEGVAQRDTETFTAEGAVGAGDAGKTENKENEKGHADPQFPDVPISRCPNLIEFLFQPTTRFDAAAPDLACCAMKRTAQAHS